MNLKLFYSGGIDGLTPQNVKEMESFIKTSPYAIIGTVDSDSGIRLSVLSNLPEQTSKELYFVTNRNYKKVNNISLDPHVELMFTNGRGSVILTGTAGLVADKELNKKLWNDYMFDFFPEGPGSDNICVIKFTTHALRAMVP